MTTGIRHTSVLVPLRSSHSLAVLPPCPLDSLNYNTAVNRNELLRNLKVNEE